MVEASPGLDENEKSDIDADKVPPSYYLMKAEPDSRIVKGKDVKFSVDDFETAQTTEWEGVRNYEARNIMQRMKVGDKVLFYHSNTRNPGIAAIAEVSKEAYPDHTAWDQNHPYYDVKSNPSSPKWFMVELRFVARVPHFVSLALLRHLSSFTKAPEEMSYLSPEDLKAIGSMALLNKGRLSVQEVQKGAWDAVNKVSEAGDGGIILKGTTKKTATAKKGKIQSARGGGGDEVVEDEVAKGKRKARLPEHGEKRRSKRSRKGDDDQ